MSEFQLRTRNVPVGSDDTADSLTFRIKRAYTGLEATDTRRKRNYLEARVDGGTELNRTGKNTERGLA